MRLVGRSGTWYEGEKALAVLKHQLPKHPSVPHCKSNFLQSVTGKKKVKMKQLLIVKLFFVMPQELSRYASSTTSCRGYRVRNVSNHVTVVDAADATERTTKSF
jgi:hypothetical protein